MHNENQIRRTMWNKVLVVVLLGAVGWCAGGVQAEINVTGPGNRGQNVVIPKKGPKPSPFTPRPRPFQSNGTFQTLDAEPSSGNVGNIIHPDPDDPSTKVFLDVTPEEVTVEAGESVQLTITATFVGTPAETALVFHSSLPEGLGITKVIHGGLRVRSTNRTTSITVSTTTSVPPGSYQFYVMGLTSENKYTNPATYILNVAEPATPPPPTTTNSGVVEVTNTFQSVILAGTYELSGQFQQVGAMFDNENDHIVNAMPVGNTSFPFPRWTRFVGLSAWTIDPGRGYASNGILTANVVVSAVVNTNYFVAAHLHVSNTGVVTPILLTAGDLTNQAGIVMSADAFEVQLEGATPTATQDGFIRGVVEGVVLFLEDENTLWADGITFTFDVPLFND